VAVAIGVPAFITAEKHVPMGAFSRAA